MSEGGHLELVALMDRNFREIRDAMKSDARSASESRKAVYQKLEEHGREQQAIKHELKNMREELDAAKPALKFHRDMTGAGKIGRILYPIGVALMAAAALVTAKWEAIASAIRALTGK